MSEKKNVFSKIDAFLKKHPWGCVGWTIFVLLVFSLIFVFALGGKELIGNTDNRTLFSRDLTYIVTVIFSLSVISSSANKLYLEENFFFFICWLALVLMEIWCWFFGLSFLLPVNVIFVVCLCYIFWHKSTPSFLVWKKILWLYASAGIAFGIAYGEYRIYKGTQNAIQKALKEPAIELIDKKDTYIFTREFGLERVSDKTPLDSLKKGDLIHRFKTDDYVIIVKHR